LYDDEGWDGERVLAEGATENRIHVFESVLNARTDEGKVRFPREFHDDIETAVDRIVADETLIPMPEPGGPTASTTSSRRSGRNGSYWRWVRPVFEGASRSSANARSSFARFRGNPSATRSPRQAAFAGLMQALPQQEHPVIIGLDWETARDNFYAAVAGGLDAEIEWVGLDGERTTTDTDRRAVRRSPRPRRSGPPDRGLSRRGGRRVARPRSGGG